MITGKINRAKWVYLCNLCICRYYLIWLPRTFTTRISMVPWNWCLCWSGGGAICFSVNLTLVDPQLPGTEAVVWRRWVPPPRGAPILFPEDPPCWWWGENWQHPSLSFPDWKSQTTLFRQDSWREQACLCCSTVSRTAKCLRSKPWCLKESALKETAPCDPVPGYCHSVQLTKGLWLAGDHRVFHLCSSSIPSSHRTQKKGMLSLTVSLSSLLSPQRAPLLPGVCTGW